MVDKLPTICLDKLVEYAGDVYKEITKVTDYTSVDISYKNMFVRIYHININEVVISIRGTDDLRDWMYNLSRWRSRFIDNTYVHSGFLQHTQQIYDKVIQNIGNKHIVHVTGHSLGGAVAILLGAKLADCNIDTKVHVVTIGSPRAGGHSFERW